MHIRRCTLTALAVAGAFCAGAPARAQVVINEVAENPPGSGSVDPFWEHIELYGPPGFDLTGYAVALLKGGEDQTGDNVPDGPFADRYPEIDEAFALDGWSLGPNGLLVLFNDVEGFSSLEDEGFFLNNPSYNSGQPVGPTNKQYLDAVGFTSLHIPTIDTPGNLANDRSSTYLLVRGRDRHSIVNGVSVYGPGYAFRKDVQHDVDFDGKIDFGFETPVSGAEGVRAVEVIQIVDEVAWSHLGGKEYVDSSDQEISDTSGFNPDALSRVAYHGRNPHAGARFDSEGEVTFTRSADEEFIYGELNSTPLLDYVPFDTMTMEANTKGPTDPNGPMYDEDGMLDPTGAHLFDDINVIGFHMTPAGFNDVDSSGSGGSNIQQFRFVPGDANFDKRADVDDLYLAWSRLGATLDDREMRTSDNETPGVPGDDFMYNAYVYEGRLLQAMLVILGMAPTDGMGGANDPAVTLTDIEALRDLIRVDEGTSTAPGR